MLSCLRCLVLFCAAVAGVTGGSEAGAVTACGCPARFEPEEPKRQEVFHRVFGAFPSPKTVPGWKDRDDSEGWLQHMQEYEREAKATANEDGRWERFLDLAQMHMTSKFSDVGWKVSRLKGNLHDEVLAVYRQSQSERRIEGNGGHTPMYIQGQREVWDSYKLGSLKERVLTQIRKKIARWVGLPHEDLEETAAYGFRIYKHGSVLKPHVDHLETHVLSAVYCLDIQEDPGTEPWTLEAVPDFAGNISKVDLRPGQLFLYESAKLPHGRPGTFQGREYAALFVHYRPKGWGITRYDRVYAVAPGWADNAPPAKKKDEL